MADNRMGRVTALRTAIGYNKTEAAKYLSELTGKPVDYKRFSGRDSWEEKEPDEYALAMVAMLHPDNPKDCFRWLCGTSDEMPEMPRLLVDSPVGYDLDAAHTIPTLSHGKALQVISQICGVLQLADACPHMQATPLLEDDEIEPFGEDDVDEQSG